MLGGTFAGSSSEVGDHTEACADGLAIGPGTVVPPVPGPVARPFARLAAIGGPRGANLPVIATTTVEGGMPELTDVS